MTRAEAARLAGMERQALRDAVVRYDAEGLAGLHSRRHPGPAPRLDEAGRAALRQLVLDGPDVEATGLSAWTLPDLRLEVARRWGVRYHAGHMSKVVRGAGPLAPEGPARAPQAGPGSPGRLRKRGLSDAVEAIRAAHPDRRLTLWCQDEARVGQKGRGCHRWFIRGRRPSGPRDQRSTWAHLFAAARPSAGQGSALIPPEASTRTMQVFLDRFATTPDADEHAVMLPDQAGWHRARALVGPGDITLVPLPPYAPQLNPAERVWLYLRERHLSHRLLAGHDAIVDACCAAWNQLTAERLRSLTNYPYLQQVNG